MAISLRAVGAPVYGTANLTPVIPAAQLTGDMMLCLYGTKPYNDAPTIDQDWTSLGYAADGTVAAGIDVGSMQTRVFWKIATSDTETNPTVTNTTNNVSTAVIIVFQKNGGETWNTPLGAGGGDATAGTDFSVTASTDVGHTAGDMVVGAASFRSDGATPTTARNITIAGCTMGTYVQSPATDPETTSGGDMGMTCGYRPVDSGTSSAAPVMTATLGGAHTGSAYLTRLRVAASAIEYGAATLSGAGAVTAIGSRTRKGTATLNGLGLLAGTGCRDLAGSAAMSGAGSVVCVGSKILVGKVTLSGIGSLSAMGGKRLNGTATLNGSGMLSGLGQRQRQGKATLSGMGELGAVGGRIRTDTVLLTGSGGLVGVGHLIASGKATLGGTGGLSGSAQRFRGGQVVFVGTGTVEVAGVLIRCGSVLLTGEGTLEAIGTVIPPSGETEYGSATLGGTGTLLAKGRRDRRGATQLSGWGSIVVAGQGIRGAKATLIGTGTLTALGTIIEAGIIHYGNVTFHGAGTLRVNGQLAIVSFDILDLTELLSMDTLKIDSLVEEDVLDVAEPFVADTIDIQSLAETDILDLTNLQESSMEVLQI